MASHAYRVFTFEMKRNGRGAAIELSEEVKDKFESVLTHLVDQKCMFGWPNARDQNTDDTEATEDKAAPVVPALTVHPPAWVSNSALHLTITMGEQGGHKFYQAPGETEPRNIVEGAAQAEYRVDFFFPDAGTKGVAVFEVISSADPRRLLRSHLITGARAVRDNLQSDYDAARQARKDAGEKVGKYVAEWVPIPTFQKIADAERIREIISSAKSSAIKFDQWEPSSRGGEASVKTRQLTIRLMDDLEIDQAVGMVKSWIRVLTEDYDARTPPTTAVLLGTQDQDVTQGDDDDPVEQAWQDFAADDFGDAPIFNQVSIQVTPHQGTPKSFAPGVMSEFFTYPISSGRPTNSLYYKSICGRVNQLGVAHSLPLAVPPPWEVVTCLKDLI